jgi:hypothetical protein
MTAVKDGWCWEGEKLPAAVDGGDGIAPQLKQKGYELQVGIDAVPGCGQVTRARGDVDMAASQLLLRVETVQYHGGASCMRVKGASGPCKA